MDGKDLFSKAEMYVDKLCSVMPNRRTGSRGNREAADFFADTIRSFGYTTDTSPFDCLDHVCGESLLTQDDEAFEVHTSPYSLGCNTSSALTTSSTFEELKETDCKDRILLMKDALCEEQLMPKQFSFYNPEHHRQIVATLEDKDPAAIITATGEKPEQVGALYPFPLIVDGDFNIPNVHCRDSVGERLATLWGRNFRLSIDAKRVVSSANNVIARLNQEASEKIVVTAHIDAYEDSPGALDNASGTSVLLLVAEMLSNYNGERCIEIAALNGEDHYSAGGQKDYIRRYKHEFNSIRMVINIDDVGFKRGKTSYSYYGCSSEQQQKVDTVFQTYGSLVQGAAWYSGDHMIFIQKGIPALACTDENMPDLMRTVTHTKIDTPDLIDCKKLVELAEALAQLIRNL